MDVGGLPSEKLWLQSNVHLRKKSGLAKVGFFFGV